MRVDLGKGLSLTVLHPLPDRINEDDSVIVRLDYGQTCFLITGGIGYGVQEAVLARDESVRCDVLQMRSHGDESVLQAAFLSAVRPALVVLTGEENEQTENRREAEGEWWARSGATVVHLSEYQRLEIVSDRLSYDVRGRP
jgi:competence protein ComEC